MTEQTAEDRLSGILRLRFGSVETEVPALPLRPAKKWVDLLAAKLAAIGASPTGDSSALLRLANETVDAALDLIVAYDRDGVLGGREWLEDNATPWQIRSALEVMREAALPFGDGVELLALMALAAKSTEPSSTSGPSDDGLPTASVSSKRRSPRTR